MKKIFGKKNFGARNLFLLKTLAGSVPDAHFIAI